MILLLKYKYEEQDLKKVIEKEKVMIVIFIHVLN